MYALVDCNSFFCAVERVFHPGLRGKPVCVLSNNDGCIVALTPEAKALGLRRGVPLYQVEDIVRHGQVRVFSSNMYLYAAMSKRVVSILRQSVQAVENYSIDECFCDLRGYECHYDLTELMRYGTSLSDILIAPVFGKVAGYFYQMLAYFVTTNLVLAVFNLIPLPPLDGYHVLNDLVLKRPIFADLRGQQIGTLLLLAGVLTGVLDKALGWVYSGVMSQIGALFTWLFELIKLM